VSPRGADPGGELLRVPADARRGQGGQVAGQGGDGWPGGDLLRRGVFGGAERGAGLLVLSHWKKARATSMSSKAFRSVTVFTVA